MLPRQAVVANEMSTAEPISDPFPGPTSRRLLGGPGGSGVAGDEAETDGFDLREAGGDLRFDAIAGRHQAVMEASQQLRLDRGQFGAIGKVGRLVGVGFKVVRRM